MVLASLLSSGLLAALAAIGGAAGWHGGQYQPPPGLEGGPLEGVVSQPGLGPVLAFDEQRWEWWFDFNQEVLVDLRRRMEQRAPPSGPERYEPLTDADRQALLPVLVEALRHRHRDVRAAAAIALGRLRLADAVRAVEIVAEGDRDLFVRTQAVLALGFSGRPQATEALARMFAEVDLGGEIRTYAAVGLGLVGDARAVDVLAAALEPRALERELNTVRAGVVYAAGLAGDAGLYRRLDELLASRVVRGEDALGALVAVALGQSGDRQWLPSVVALLGHGSNQVRRSAAMAIEALAPVLQDDDVPALVAAFEDDGDLAVRLALLRALGRARTPASRAWLVGIAGDVPYLMRTHHALALGFDGDPAHVEPLRAALAEAREESLRAAIAVALGLLEDPGAGAVLVPLLERGGSPLQRGYVCLALGLADPPQPQAGELLDEQCRTSHDVEVLRLAMMGLGLLGERARIDRIAAGLGEVAGVLDRAALVYGLGLVGDRDHVAALVARVEDADELTYVKAYALQAIAELGDPRPLPPTWRLSRHVDLSHDVGFLFELYRAL